MEKWTQERKERGRERSRKGRKEKKHYRGKEKTRASRRTSASESQLEEGGANTRCHILRRWIIDLGFEAAPLIISRNLGILSGI